MRFRAVKQYAHCQNHFLKLLDQLHTVAGLGPEGEVK